jgi:hypothetical protein
MQLSALSVLGCGAEEMGCGRGCAVKSRAAMGEEPEESRHWVVELKIDSNDGFLENAGGRGCNLPFTGPLNSLPF